MPQAFAKNCIAPDSMGCQARRNGHVGSRAVLVDEFQVQEVQDFDWWRRRRYAWSETWLLRVRWLREVKPLERNLDTMVAVRGANVGGEMISRRRSGQRRRCCGLNKAVGAIGNKRAGDVSLDTSLALRGRLIALL